MKLIELKFSNGNHVYVNHERIESIADDMSNEGLSIVRFDSHSFHVVGTAKEIYDKILSETEPPYITVTTTLDDYGRLSTNEPTHYRSADS